MVELGLDLGGEGDVGGTGRMDGPTLVDDVLGGADPVWDFFGCLEDLLVYVFFVFDVGVVVWVSVLKEVVGDALAGEGESWKRIVEEGG